MDKKERFAANLRMLLRGYAIPLVAMELGIPYKRLWRWITEGIERPTRATLPDLEKLRAKVALDSVGDLWLELDLIAVGEWHLDRAIELLGIERCRQLLTEKGSPPVPGLLDLSPEEAAAVEEFKAAPPKEAVDAIRQGLTAVGYRRADKKVIRKAIAVYLAGGASGLNAFLEKYKQANPGDSAGASGT